MLFESLGAIGFYVHVTYTRYTSHVLIVDHPFVFLSLDPGRAAIQATQLTLFGPVWDHNFLLLKKKKFNLKFQRWGVACLHNPLIITKSLETHTQSQLIHMLNVDLINFHMYQWWFPCVRVKIQVNYIFGLCSLHYISIGSLIF